MHCLGVTVDTVLVRDMKEFEYKYESESDAIFKTSFLDAFFGLRPGTLLSTSYEPKGCAASSAT